MLFRSAGAGRSMEVIGKLIGVPLEEIGGLSLQPTNGAAEVSATCVLFAKTDVLNLLQAGQHVNSILAGYCDALARRVHNLLNRVGVTEDFVITGGIAKNIGVTKRVEELLGMKANISDEPQIIGALGAAIFARDLLEKSKQKS